MLSLSRLRICAPKSPVNGNASKLRRNVLNGGYKEKKLSSRGWRAYSSTESKDTAAEEVGNYAPHMTKPNYGFTDVVLNTDRYYASFADVEHFERPGELAWMLWQPPVSIVNMDDWVEVHRTMGASKTPSPASFAYMVLFSSDRLANLKAYSAGARSAFLSVVENINAGNLQALESSLHRSAYNYVKGWLQYMKKHGYTWKHTVEEIVSVSPSGASLVSVWGPKKQKKPEEKNDDAEDDEEYANAKLGFDYSRSETSAEDSPVTYSRYHDDPHFSIVGNFSDSFQRISAFTWVKISAKEKFEILDAKGSVVLSSPSRLNHHIWKFGASSSIPGKEFDEKMARYKKKGKDIPEKLLGEWDFKLYDIDNQVIQRASEILTKQKVFLDADAPKDEVWEMTRAF